MTSTNTESRRLKSGGFLISDGLFPLIALEGSGAKDIWYASPDHPDQRDTLTPKNHALKMKKAWVRPTLFFSDSPHIIFLIILCA
ncbi:hypothetical protein [uncultured Cohaesibacter sp.]|uniref:hypothetical protein n=1 Tax=uncultured Cohaesibacter sp. TaxID=1002546 RepID=UPI0029C81881|nr:hypothetical protein [uncultured Cohaesibacter sp.]